MGNGFGWQSRDRLRLNHPELELAGCWVHSQDKDGRDVGEIVGTSPLGVAATSSIDDILAIDADAVVYAPLIATRMKSPRCCGPARTSSARWGGSIRPSARPQPLAAACAEGNVSLHGTGIHPGGVTEVFPLMFSAVSSAVTFVRAEEFSDIRTYGAPDVVRHIMCFGGTREEAESGPMLKLLTGGFKQSIHMVLQALGLAGKAEIRTSTVSRSPPRRSTRRSDRSNRAGWQLSGSIGKPSSTTTWWCAPASTG